MARGRPPIIADERLLEIAREVFLERGIRATTADVAERAGVSEATVFHRYKTKDSLFRAAMRTDINTIPSVMCTLEERIGKGDLAEHLFEIGMGFLEFGRARLPLMMLSWSNPDTVLCRMREDAEPAAQLHRCFTAYLDAERLGGRLRSGDPEILTGVFFGSLHGFLVGELMEWKRPNVSAGSFVRGLADLVAGNRTGASSPSFTSASGRR